MPTRKNSWTIPRPRMSGGPGWTTSPTPPPSASASSAGPGRRPSSARAARSSRSRSHPAPPGPSTWPPANARTAGLPRRGRAAAGPARRRAVVRKVARRAGINKIVTRIRCGTRSPPQLDAGVPLRDVQEAASHADPRTTMRYDRARGSLDRHATYIVAAYVAGAARYTPPPGGPGPPGGQPMTPVHWPGAVGAGKWAGATVGPVDRSSAAGYRS